MILNLKKTLYSKTAIRKRVVELGKDITKKYKGKEIMAIPVLEGGMIFASDLIREIDLPLTIHTINVSSYHGESFSSGKINMEKAHIPFCDDKYILLVDDIYDTGLTLNTLRNTLKLAGAADVKTCVLLDKQGVRNTKVKPDFYGFKVKNEFVVGYGLDYKNLYRNLPYIGVLNAV